MTQDIKLDTGQRMLQLATKCAEIGVLVEQKLAGKFPLEPRLKLLKEKLDEIMSDEQVYQNDIAYQHGLEALDLFKTTISQMDDLQLSLEIGIFCFGNLAGPLPIYRIRRAPLGESKVIVVSSATGSGKSLIYPLILYQNQNFNQIITTQPNSMFVGKSILMMNMIANTPVAYRLRRLKDVQRGVFICTPIELMRALGTNIDWYSQCCFVLDEFHERRVEQDVVIALLKRQSIKKNQLVLMSATPDNLVSKHFGESTKLTTDGARPYHVEEYHISVPKIRDVGCDKPGSIFEKVLKEMVARQIPNIGNILCFTSGKRECEKIIQNVLAKEIPGVFMFGFQLMQHIDNLEQLYEFLRSKLEGNKLLVIPVLFAGKATELEKEFATKPLPGDFKGKCIKAIVATNIAETSITIEDLVVLIDTGLFKEVIYDDVMNVEKLTEKCISLSSRQQRIGRVGRLCPGIAYLYHIEKDIAASGKPEIERIDIQQKILHLKRFHINLEDLNQFLPSPIDNQRVNNTIKYLQEMQLIDSSRAITRQGRELCVYDFINLSMAIVIDRFLKSQQYVELFICLISQILVTNDHQLCGDMQKGYVQQFFCEESDFASFFMLYIDIVKKNKQLSQEELLKFYHQNDINVETLEFLFERLQILFTDLQFLQRDEIQCQLYDQIIHYTQNATKAIIFKTLDTYIQLLTQAREEIKPGYGYKYYCNFSHMAYVTGKASQIYDLNHYLAQQSQNQTISCFERIGTNVPIAFDQVYFGQITYNQTADIFVGKYIHKSFYAQEQQQHVNVVESDTRAFSAPYFTLLTTIFFQNRSPLIQMYSRKLKTKSMFDHVYIARSDENHYYFCSNQNLNNAQIQSIKQQTQQLVQLALNSPYSIISKYSKTSNIIFTQGKDFQVITSVFEDNTRYAYELNQSSLQYIINHFNQLGIQNLNISLILDFDCIPTDNNVSYVLTRTNYQFNKYPSRYAFEIDKKTNQLAPKLVIFSTSQIPELNNCQLFWNYVNAQQVTGNDYLLHQLKKHQDIIQMSFLTETFVLKKSQKVFLKLKPNNQLSKYVQIQNCDIKDTVKLNSDLPLLFKALVKNQLPLNSQCWCSQVLSPDDNGVQPELLQVNPQSNCQTLNGITTIVIQQNEQLPQLLDNYDFCQIQLVQLTFNEENESIKQLCAEFGCFARQSITNNKRLVVQIRTVEAALAFMNKAQFMQTTFKLHSMPLEMLAFPSVRDYLNKFAVQHNLDIEVTEKGFAGNSQNIVEFKQLIENKDFQNQLPMKQIFFYGALHESIVNMVHRDDSVKIDFVRRCLFCSDENFAAYKKQVDSFMIQHQNHMQCHNNCDQPMRSNNVLVTYDQHSPTCFYFCVKCFQKQLQESISQCWQKPDENQISGPFGLNFVSLAITNNELANCAYQVLQNVVCGAIIDKQQQQ